MATALSGLFVAGEVVGGANGANRLSGNAITEALVFGRRAGRSAADHARQAKRNGDNTGRAALDLITVTGPDRDLNTAAMITSLQATMQRDVATSRSQATLTRALKQINELNLELGEHPPGPAGAFDLRRLDWFDLRNMLLVARTVTQAALVRTESRGAHQREDYPEMDPGWTINQVVRLHDGELVLSAAPTTRLAAAQ